MSNTMDWSSLYFGHVDRKEVQEYIPEENWQALRISLKGTSTEFKYEALQDYLINAQELIATNLQNDGILPDSQRYDEEFKILMRPYHVRITNYVTALSRGGQIKITDYR